MHLFLCAITSEEPVDSRRRGRSQKFLEIRIKRPDFFQNPPVILEEVFLVVRFSRVEQPCWLY